jgi:hypothetical protein
MHVVSVAAQRLARRIANARKVSVQGFERHMTVLGEAGKNHVARARRP